MTNPELFESSLSRLLKKHLEHDCGTITAYRGERTRSENDRLNRILLTVLTGRGYSVTSVTGHYEERTDSGGRRTVKERSYLVCDHKDTGKLRDDLILLGERFGQETVTYWNSKQKRYGLIGTSRKPVEDSPKYCEMWNIGHPIFGRDGKIHSSLGNRPFVIKITESDRTDSIERKNWIGRLFNNKFVEAVYEKNLDCVELLKMYEKDREIVETVDFIKKKQPLIESSLSRLWQKHKDYDAGTITAYRGERTNSENRSLNAKLKSALLGGGYSVTEIDGVYTENYGTKDARDVKERAFIVFDHKKSGKLYADLKRLGELYDQDSITFWDVKKKQYKIIGTSKRDTAYPKYRQEIVLGKPMFGVDGEFHSKISGRPFVFKESEGFYMFGHRLDDTILNYNTPHKQLHSRTYKESFVEALEESSLSRLWQKHQESDAGTISAYRGERTRSENQSLNRALSAALIGKGYSVTSITGIFVENQGMPNEKKVKEQSFIVFDRNKTGKLKNDLIALGEKFEQESITYWNVKENKYYLIGTTRKPSDYGSKYKEEKVLGMPMFSKTGECYSTVSGRPFTIQESTDLKEHTILDHTNHGKMWFVLMRDFVFNENHTLKDILEFVEK